MPHDYPSPEAALHALLERFCNALVARDPVALGELLTEDYRFTTPNGGAFFLMDGTSNPVAALLRTSTLAKTRRGSSWTASGSSASGSKPYAQPRAQHCSARAGSSP
jgi:hypothetical protein